MQKFFPQKKKIFSASACCAVMLSTPFFCSTASAETSFHVNNSDLTTASNLVFQGSAAVTVLPQVLSDVPTEVFWDSKNYPYVENIDGEVFNSFNTSNLTINKQKDGLNAKDVVFTITKVPGYNFSKNSTPESIEEATKSLTIEEAENTIFQSENKLSLSAKTNSGGNVVFNNIPMGVYLIYEHGTGNDFYSKQLAIIPAHNVENNQWDGVNIIAWKTIKDPGTPTYPSWGETTTPTPPPLTPPSKNEITGEPVDTMKTPERTEKTFVDNVRDPILAVTGLNMKTLFLALLALTSGLLFLLFVKKTRKKNIVENN